MAALPKFSFSGWTSQSLAPKVNPATVPPVGLPAAPTVGLPPGVRNVVGSAGSFNTLRPQPITTPGLTAPTAPGQLVAQTSAANTSLPAWLQAEVDRLNAQDALRTQMAGQVTGGGGTQNIGDILQGVAAVTSARGGFNTSLNQINEQARLQNLITQRSQLRPTGGFGFNDPLQVPRMLDLDRQISGYQNVNLPLAAGAVGGFRPSGWVNPFRTF